MPTRTTKLGLPLQAGRGGKAKAGDADKATASEPSGVMGSAEGGEGGTSIPCVPSCTPQEGAHIRLKVEFAQVRSAAGTSCNPPEYVAVLSMMTRYAGHATSVRLLVRSRECPQANTHWPHT